MMAIKTVYLAGPMTGLPNFNFDAFNAAAKHLRKFGFNVLNPARHGEGFHYKQYMKMAVEDVFNAHLILCLPGFEQSKGVKAELTLANAIDVEVQELKVWIYDQAERMANSPINESTYHQYLAMVSFMMDMQPKKASQLDEIFNSLTAHIAEYEKSPLSLDKDKQ